MTKQQQQQSKEEPLLVEITPKIAADMLVILDYMPESEEEPTAEEIVAMAISYFKNQLESGETQFVEGGQQAPSK
jgi:hypothetical protein